MKKCNQRNSGIGGQAVLEGVMMRNGEDYAIAVRRSDGSITVKKEKYKGFFADSPLKKIPFVRGIFVFIDSMVLGLRCTDYSASIYAEDDPDEADKDKDKESSREKESEESALEKFMMAAVMVFSFALAIGLFMVLPYFIASRLINLIGNANLLSVFEGVDISSLTDTELAALLGDFNLEGVDLDALANTDPAKANQLFTENLSAEE